MGLYRGTDVAGGAIHFYSPQNLSLSNANTRVVCAQFSVILVKCANEVFCAAMWNLMGLTLPWSEISLHVHSRGTWCQAIVR